jgi:hypothetical protein
MTTQTLALKNFYWFWVWLLGFPPNTKTKPKFQTQKVKKWCPKTKIFGFKNF